MTPWWGTLLATFLGGLLASAPPIVDRQLTRRRKDRIARRAWRDDLYAAQNLIATAMRNGQWPEHSWQPRDDQEDLVHIASHGPHRDRWTNFTVGRRAALALTHLCDGGRMSESDIHWAAKAFRKLELAREALPLPDFKFRDHPRLDDVNQRSPAELDPPDLFF